MFRYSIITVSVALLLLSVISVHADVFNMPGGQTSLQFVTVGDPGNAADPATGNLYGSVPYIYQMGEYDVTVGQYCQFLNAVAKTDTYSLYNIHMANYFSTIGIARSGSSGNYNYSVTYSSAAWQTYSDSCPGLYPSPLAAASACPITFVSWGDAARFCNWLQNSQPTGAEGNGTTETGSYTLNGAMSQTALMAVTRNAGATYVIPTENEWYKAAYYKGGGMDAGYWAYPTQSNTAPINILSSTGTNNANFSDYYGSYSDPTNYLTPVGAFSASSGPYGTYDMGGDAWQWNETAANSSVRGERGSGWDNSSSCLASAFRSGAMPTLEGGDLGFRVASVPEPGSIVLLVGAAIVGLMWWRWRV
jgi:formylglycine-generating enzyme required for sulfatase activity